MKARWVLAVCLLAAALALAAPTITVTPSTAAPGSIVTISITGGQDAETCGIEIRDPANTVIFTKQITLSNGAGSVQWGIPSDARAGDYTVYASCTTPGAATTVTITVTPLVGGEVKKDYTPFILTLAVATIAAASFVLLKRELKG